MTAAVKGFGRFNTASNTSSATLAVEDGAGNPIDLAVGDRVIAILGLASRAYGPTATVGGLPMTQVQTPVSGAGALKFGGHGSHVFELLIDEEMVEPDLVLSYTLFADGTAATTTRASVAYVVIEGAGADHYLASVASDSFAVAGSVNTVTTPSANAPADSIEVSLVSDSENDTDGTGGEYGTSTWTAPGSITKVVEDVNITSGNPQASVAIGVDLTPTLVSGSRGDREWDATNNDGTARSAWTLVYAPDNARPVAVAGPNLVVEPFEPFERDGNGSTDDVAVTSGTWTQISGTTVTLNGPGLVVTVDEAPASATGEDLVFQLVVTDAEGAVSNPDTTTVTVLPANYFFLTSEGWTPMRRTWL